MADQTPAEKELDFEVITRQVLGAILTQLPQMGVQKAVVNAQADARGTIYAIIHDVAVELAVKMGSTLHECEEPFLPIIAGFVAPIIGGLFGAEVGSAEFSRRLSQGGGAPAARAIVDGLMKAIAGDAGAELTPSPTGATRIAGAAVQASLEST